MSLRLTVIRRARSGPTVRKMTTSVYVFELHTSALGYNKYTCQLSVDNSNGFAHNHRFPSPPDHNLHTSRLDRLRRAMLERPPRARTTDLGPETLQVPNMGPNEHKSTLTQVQGGLYSAVTGVFPPGVDHNSGDHHTTALGEDKTLKIKKKTFWW